MSETNKDAIGHAWDWFQYHANQRMTMIRFYLVVAGAIATGVGFLWTKNEFALSAVLSVYGAIISFCFLRLDARVAGLVKLGEDALKVEQEKISISLNAPAFNICAYADNVRDKNGKRKFYIHILTEKISA